MDHHSRLLGTVSPCTVALFVLTQGDPSLLGDAIKHAFGAGPVVGVLVLLMSANILAIAYVWWYQAQEIKRLREERNEAQKMLRTLKNQREAEQAGQIVMLQELLSQAHE